MAVLLHWDAATLKIQFWMEPTEPLPHIRWGFGKSQSESVYVLACVWTCFSCLSPSPFCSFWQSMAVLHQGNCQCPHPFHRCSRPQPSRPHTVKTKACQEPRRWAWWEAGVYKGLCSCAQAQREGPEPGGFVGRILKLLSCVLNIVV